MLPNLVAHLDWSIVPIKRWIVKAVLRDDATYLAGPPECVVDTRTLISVLKDEVGGAESVLAGFDFPIGLPAFYASKAKIGDFKSLLPLLGQGRWSQFFNICEHKCEINVYRPFYPYRPGNTRQKHLTDALGAKSMDDLRRQCEMEQPHRRAACPLFWTLGAQQVGRAAISGWQEILGPRFKRGEQNGNQDVFLWPFDGPLSDLLRRDRIIIAETYPAEYYRHFFNVIPPWSKTRQEDRKRVAKQIIDSVRSPSIKLDPILRDAIADGFGPDQTGEDRFDAVMGLFGMLKVIKGELPSGEPDEETIKKIEGWILGQSAE